MADSPDHDQAVTPEQVLAEAGFDPDFNVCVGCKHHGGDHDLNNKCLLCDCDLFGSMTEQQKWDHGLAALAERGYRVSKDGDCIEATLEVTEDDLSTAWAAAEAALPYKRGGIELTMFNRNDGPYSVAVADSWPAGGEAVHVEASGPTPTAALLNLATQLSQAGRKEPSK